MKIIVILGLVLVAGGVGWYALSPLFNPLKTNEVLPADTMAMKKESATSTASSTEESGAMMQKEEQMMKELSGTVTGTVGHPASGTVKIVRADGKEYVRYENLKTINGPDIFVYLSKDMSAKEFVNLGKVKSTEGNSNYEIPAGTNPAEYPYVLIWCKQFGVLFNSAKLSS